METCLSSSAILLAGAEAINAARLPWMLVAISSCALVHCPSYPTQRKDNERIQHPNPIHLFFPKRLTPVKQMCPFLSLGDKGMCVALLFLLLYVCDFILRFFYELCF